MITSLFARNEEKKEKIEMKIHSKVILGVGIVLLILCSLNQTSLVEATPITLSGTSVVQSYWNDPPVLTWEVQGADPIEGGYYEIWYGEAPTGIFKESGPWGPHPAIHHGYTITYTADEPPRSDDYTEYNCYIYDYVGNIYTPYDVYSTWVDYFSPPEFDMPFPDNLIVEEFQDFTLGWYVYETFVDQSRYFPTAARYNVTVNGEVVEQGYPAIIATNQPLSVLYTGAFSAGFYTIECILYDDIVTSPEIVVIDTVYVEVEMDDTPPSLIYAEISHSLVPEGYEGPIQVYFDFYEPNPGVAYIYLDEEVIITHDPWQSALGFIFFLQDFDIGVGEHTFTCVAFDINGNGAETSVFFEVYRDETPPEFILTPQDLYINEGERTVLTWEVTDHSTPGTYEIFLDDTSVKIGDWIGFTPQTAQISLILNDPTLSVYPSIGSHTITCRVTDGLGYSAEDIVIVNVGAPLNWVTVPVDQVLVVGEQVEMQMVVQSATNVMTWSLNNEEDFDLTIDYYPGGSSCILRNKTTLPASSYDLEITVTDFDGYTLSKTFTITILEPEPVLITFKLSGSFDYLEKEEIHLQIAGLLTDSETGAVIAGATVTFEIYNPDGIVIISGMLFETTPGVYVYKADDTIKNLKDTLAKGIYWVYAHATTLDGREAVDMIQFHIDPPGGAAFNLSPWSLPLIVGVLALLSGSVGGSYLKRR